MVSLTKIHSPPAELVAIFSQQQCQIERKTEINRLQKQLEQQNIVVIKGMLGCGKSTLAYQLLAQSSAERKLWLSFRRGGNDSLDALAWDIAGLLAKFDNSNAIEFLQTPNTSVKSFPIRIQLARIIDELQKKSTILCVDNYEVVVHNRPIRSFFEEIREQIEGVSNTCLGLIVTTTVEPLFLYDFGNLPLTGFSLNESEAFLKKNKIQLHPEKTTCLWRRTSGMPMLLQWFVEWYREQGDRVDGSYSWEEIISRLSTHVFLSRCTEDLQDSEKRLLEIISIFRQPISYSILRDEICIDEDHVPVIGNVVAELFSHYLLKKVSSNNTDIMLPEVLRASCFSMLDQTSRQRLHHKAECYYQEMQNEKEALHHNQTLQISD